MKQLYIVHKTFLDGVLKGLTITEKTSVRFETGKAYGGGWTGSRYRVTSCVPAPTPEPTIPAEQPPSTILHITI